MIGKAQDSLHSCKLPHAVALLETLVKTWPVEPIPLESERLRAVTGRKLGGETEYSGQFPCLSLVRIFVRGEKMSIPVMCTNEPQHKLAIFNFSQSWCALGKSHR